MAVASQKARSPTFTRSRMCCRWPGRRTAVFVKPVSRLVGSSTPGTGKRVETYSWATVAPPALPVLVTSKLTVTVPSGETCDRSTDTLEYAKVV